MARQTAQTPDDGLQRLKADLKNGEFQNFYIFCGEEAYLREHYLRMLTGKLTGGPAGAFNEHRFSAEQLTPEVFSEALEAMPMMAERTFIRVDDVDLFKLPEAQRTQYAQLLSDIPDYCCVVFSYDTVEFKINGTMKKLAEAVRKNACVVEFKRQSERELAAWIARHFRAAGKDISDELCRYLIFITDGMMTTLGPEIQKVANYCTTPAGARSDIDAMVTPALKARTFDISNAIAGGEYERALTGLRELFAMQEDCNLILGAIGSQMRRLHYAKTIMACGKGQDVLMELTGLKSYPAGLTMTAARRASEGFCRRAVELCLQTDVRMKTSYDDPERLLELLVVELAQEARRG